MAAYNKVVSDLHASFATGKTKTKEWRMAQLLALLNFIEKESDGIAEALAKDLSKPFLESIVFECDTVRNEIVEALDKLDEWMGKKKAEKNLLTLLDSAFVMSEPLGVVLIIGAWNYPFQLTLGPLVGAIAAGNCAIVKPSEISISSSQFMEKKLLEYLDPECIKIITGGVPETTSLLTNRFDHIFYTGSTAVGKIIYKAAAEHLTPVTLELGGKSPAIIDNTSDLAIVARRMMWGKLCNSGQTCISPDYVLCTKENLNFLIEECKSAIYEFHNGDSKRTPHFSRIINKHHFQRLKQMLDKTEGTVAYGGTIDEDSLYISPTLLVNVKESDCVMQEEIFGPIMPFLTVSDMDEAIEFVNKRPKPLVIYLFTKDNQLIKQVSRETLSGAMVTNDVFMNMSLTSLPFGGVGDSGIGSSHGIYAFQAFSHMRAHFVKKQNMEFMNQFRYPPYNDKNLKIIRWALERTPHCQRNPILLALPYIALAILFAILFKLLHSLIF
ncbi:hypothetical protein HELRODRAFT_185832 [Helobdella robusta]|uniref:Aldehyde dehydrogenase n=1 Tax=Helobdella robusta TaxID=6412 RepID=T1FNC6_HELRO|nr:hypothetical protein HELRODRAFT_185832 [Helobdella robusta]ESN98475.1 hypothetical protein HELRODRAFT_185832 [Helobdella robusta]